ncbi:MAG: pyridoxamine 5'-phosphate oxidase [Bacteriovorax sp.]|nr:pyridoxamine 5'-phosphate oxidase [Bacteriovorax sp.]
MNVRKQRSYNMDDLFSYTLNQNPLKSFLDWFEEANKLEQNAPAMSVSTYDQDLNRPNIRYLLYKGIKENKILFYSNYLSPKAKDLNNNPEIALGFYWHLSKKQVRIHGRVTKMTKEDSESYFQSRDRDSQIASYLSMQSEPIQDKNTLLLKFKTAEELFAGKPIPLPLHWGGYLVEPYEYEFFLYGENRLNDRFLYQLKNQNWEVSRLQP